MPFAEMTGSKAKDRRVVVLDGFAGRGRYPHGNPGSAELILQTSVNAKRAVIESLLVEKKPSDFKRLAAVVAEYRARGVRSEALPGDVVHHLPKMLTQAAGVPGTYSPRGARDGWRPGSPGAARRAVAGIRVRRTDRGRGVTGESAPDRLLIVVVCGGTRRAGRTGQAHPRCAGWVTPAEHSAWSAARASSGRRELGAWVRTVVNELLDRAAGEPAGPRRTSTSRRTPR